MPFSLDIPSVFLCASPARGLLVSPIISFPCQCPLHFSFFHLAASLFFPECCKCFCVIDFTTFPFLSSFPSRGLSTLLRKFTALWHLRRLPLMSCMSMSISLKRMAQLVWFRAVFLSGKWFAKFSQRSEIVLMKWWTKIITDPKQTNTCNFLFFFYLCTHSSNSQSHYIIRLFCPSVRLSRSTSKLFFTLRKRSFPGMLTTLLRERGLGGFVDD